MSDFSSSSDESFTVTIDGREVRAEKGAVLLDVIRGMGIEIPALCSHPSLAPTGACRLCVVEVGHPDWKGWSGLVTSCLYPASPGLIVATRSKRVSAVRRTLLQMLLARCPDAQVVRDLARDEGVRDTPFAVTEGADKCVLCGLCVRVCQDLGPGAVAPLGRGSEKEVGPRPDKVGEDCTGCGACALVCPTGEIALDRRPGGLSIWNRDFSFPPYAVDVGACRGCGVCEEVCPLSIPRVVARRGGTFASFIDPGRCISCGLCAGACPAGAIARTKEGEKKEKEKEKEEEEKLPAGDLAGKVVVFACSRSVLPSAAAEGAAVVQEAVVKRVPCAGRVTAEAMLECLARRASGVLVLGRDKETCAFGPGEDLAASRTAVCGDLAAMAGLGAGRVRFLVPPPGLDGPERALASFRESLAPSPLEAALPEGTAAAAGVPGSGMGPSPGVPPAGLDGARRVMAWLLDRPELEPVLPGDLAGLFGGKGKGRGEGKDGVKEGAKVSGGNTVLYLGDLPVLDRLLSLLSGKGWLKSLMEDAAALLARKGIAVQPVMTSREAAAAGAERVLTFCACCPPDFGPGVTVRTLDEAAGAEAHPAPGAAAAPAAGEIPAPLAAPFRFRIGPGERAALTAAFGLSSLRCACPGQVAQLELVGREGAWQAGLLQRPVMAFQEALLAAEGKVSS